VQADESDDDSGGNGKVLCSLEPDGNGFMALPRRGLADEPHGLGRAAVPGRP